MTVIKKFKEKKENEKNKKLNFLKNKKGENNRIKSDNNVNKNIKINFNNNYDNDKGKLIKFFKKKNSAGNNDNNDIKNNEKINLKFKIVDNKEINDEKYNNNEPFNFLKENLINIKNIKIVDKEKDSKNDEKKVNIGNLKNLINEDDIEKLVNINKINEEHYNQMRYLNNLSKLIKQDIPEEIEDNNNINELEKINEEEENIQTENDSIKFNEIKFDLEKNKNNSINENKKIDNEDKEITELKNKIIQEIGNDIFNMVYKCIDDYTDKTEIKFNAEIIADKLAKEFNNNKFDKVKLKLAIDKLPEIFAIVIQNRLN